MSSRFFRGVDSDSETESEEELSEEEELKTPKKWQWDSDSDDDQPGKKKVVKSQKDKRFEEVESTVTATQNHMKINDWNSVQSDFEKLNKQVQKLKQNFASEGTPRVYLKFLIVLEEKIKEVTTEQRKKFSQSNSKSYNAMKQKSKKTVKSYESDITEYQNNPSESEDEEDSDDDDEDWDKDDGLDDFGAPIFPDKEEGLSDGEDAPYDDNDFNNEDGETENRWLLKEGKSNKGSEKRQRKDKGSRSDKSGKTKDAPAEEEKKELTGEDIVKKLKALASNRGKRGTRPDAQIAELNVLLTHCKDQAGLIVSVTLQLVTSLFDKSMEMGTYMSLDLWKSTYDNLDKIMNLVEENSLVLEEEEPVEEVPQPKIAPTETQMDGDDDSDPAPEEEEELSHSASGNLLSYLERLDNEMIKSLQNIDPHLQLYVQRLGDEQSFLSLAKKVQAYYTRIDQLENAAIVASRIIEHIYYKTDRLESPTSPAEKSEESVTEGAETEKAPVESVKTSTLIQSLATLVYNHGTERLKSRTILCLIYFHSLNDKFHEARDMLLMSHLQDTISTTQDISTQILFNRATAQLGLCAFRLGLIHQAHSCLSDLYASGKVKELLAQGLTNQRYMEKNPEQERLEKKRQIPFHMHINSELLEAAHLISAMLLEVPNMAANAFEPKKKIISRTFRKLIDFYARQVFSGPPENIRDVVFAATQALSSGEWEKCTSLLLELKIWNLLPHPEEVKEKLKKQIQIEGIRTYLFSYGPYYDSISLKQISELYQLETNEVHSIVSKMMINDELHASWDQPTSSIVMHKVEPTKLQYLALQFAEKATMFVENNERLLDSQTPGYAYKFDNNKSNNDGHHQQHSQNYGYGQHRNYNNNNRNNRNQYNNNNNRNNNNSGDGYQQQRYYNNNNYNNRHNNYNQSHNYRNNQYQRR